MAGISKCLGALLVSIAVAGCFDAEAWRDADARDHADPGAEAADPGLDLPEGANDLADPGQPEAISDPAPVDLPSDPAPDPTDAVQDVPADAPSDVSPEAFDIPEQTCCMYDSMCPAGWECVAIDGGMGACKPRPGEGACWSGHDCGPGRTCVGANPCPCDAEEGDGCDIPGYCVEDIPGCCDTDWDCPFGEVCAKGGLCQPAAAPGRCWRDSDCYGTQDCVGVASCRCGALCDIDPGPGTCLPLPPGCCNSDADCPDDTECRFADALDHLPGRCVGAHLGPGCEGGAACCWQDFDCTGGWCQDAYGCGCIDLCPTCGACMQDQMGLCHSWEIDVALQATGEGQCRPGDAHPAFTAYVLPLQWHTSLPAKTQIAQAVNAFTGHEGYMLMEEGYVTEHSWDMLLGSYYFEGPPKPGDTILIRVRATAEDGGTGLSEPLEIPVDEALADCVFPYDRTCSDGTPIVCRALPPPCDEDKVMAAFQGCQHCVYASTCTCDDGTAMTCPVDETPTCEAGRVLAVQKNCWVCVNPMTCNDRAWWQ